MLTKTLLALKATLSHKPETKQQARMGASECAGSMSSRSVVAHPAWGVFSGGGVLWDESDETLGLRGPGVLVGDSLVTSASDAAMAKQLFE